MKVVSYITDPVTTTDELIPSGETSSYRSNPLRLAEFALSRKDPAYVGRAKEVHALELAREQGQPLSPEIQAVYAADARPRRRRQRSGPYGYRLHHLRQQARRRFRPEQAASCQRVLGAAANLAREYATKRYRSNCINWGMAPFLVKDADAFALGDYVFVPGLRKAILEGTPEFNAYAVKADGTVTAFPVSLGDLTKDERQIIIDGCLINYYRGH